MHKNFDKEIQDKLLYKIHEKSRKIKFLPKEHKYFLDVFELSSVSSYIDNYKKKFETYKIASKLCKTFNTKHSLYNTLHERKAEYYVELWGAKRDMAAAKGTYIHLFAQTFPYFDEPKIKEHNFIIDYFNNLKSNYIFIGSEIRVFSTKLKLAGTLDGLLWNKETNKLAIIDFKTNEDLHKKDSGYFNKPFHKFKSTKVNHYTLQLNFYKYCLEEMFEKDLVESLQLIWINDINDSYKIIPLQILNLKDYLNIK
ncbi:MAG TPA: PD-(D/E)XK nuclease family protein [Burkholderiales bacterium]|nr:PD-(D/E)XK nuclease family protein [Burkholderiales bacterium]